MSELDAARIETVKRHMALEITHDWDGVIATFDHPRYELLGPGTTAGTPDDGGASKRPAPTPAAGGRPTTPPATGTTNGATR